MDAVEAALTKLDRLLRVVLDGGFRVQAREILAELWDAGVTEGSWKPSGTQEGIRGAGNGSEGEGWATGALPEGTVPLEGWPDGFWRTKTSADGWGELRRWWYQAGADEIDGMLAKMIDYGGAERATDLTDLGRSLIEAGVREPADFTQVPTVVPDAYLQELGAYFYIRGKFARWVAAIREGRPVADDTIHDMIIYLRMVQRIRARGGWPV